MKSKLRARIAELQAIVLQLIRQRNFLDVCHAHLGKDASPNDLAPDELGCAETVTTLMRKAYPQTPIMIGTYALYLYLRDPRNGWKQVSVPQPGDIVISPTGMGFPGTVGHVGIVDKHNVIMSNSSFSKPQGLFLQNYTIGSWEDFFHRENGFPVFYFRKS